MAPMKEGANHQHKTNVQREEKYHSKSIEPAYKKLLTANIDLEKCQPKINIVFIKTFKTGGSTVTNILSRYAMKQNLNINGHSLCNGAKGQFKHCDFSQVSTNVISEHVWYNRNRFTTVMPNDTIYVTQLRQPLSQLISILNYKKQFNVTDPVDDYNTWSPVVKFHRIANTWRQLNIPMDSTRGDVEFYLQQLDQELDLVLITEQLDLSLLLLRRKLCWDISDMLYIPLKKASYKQNKNLQTLKDIYLNQTDLFNRRYEQSNPNAYQLYNYFNKTFGSLLSMAGQDLQEELLFYQVLNKKVASFCSKYSEYIIYNSSNFLNIVDYSDVLTIPASKWGNARTMDPIDCAMMHLAKRAFQEISLMKEKGIDFLNSTDGIQRRNKWLLLLLQPVHPKYGIPLPVLTNSKAYDILDEKI